MFWGLTLSPGKRHTEVLTEEICLSMATLESRKNLGEKPDNYSHVLVKRGKMNYLLCTLVHGLQFQQNLNLKLMPKEKITFKVQGTSQVHLTGFTPTCPVDEIDMGDDDDDDDDDEDEAIAPPVVARVTIERGEEAGWLVDVNESLMDDPVEDVIESLSGEEFNQTEEQPEEQTPLDDSTQGDQEGVQTGNTTREDNFLSVAELGNIPLKVEVQDGEEMAGTNNNQARSIAEGNGQPSAIRDGGASSGEESDNDWILDDNIQPVPEGSIETEFNVDLEGTVSYPCTQCKHKFATDEARLQHEEASHSTPDTGPPPLVRMTNEGIKYQCKYCSKLLANRNTLRRHEALHRGNRMNVSCKHCLKVCNNSYNRMRHETVCGKKASRGSKSGGKLYRCLICDIAFDQVQVRDKHVLGHFKKDGQRCNLCRQVSCKGECAQSEGVINSETSSINSSSSRNVREETAAGPFRCQFCPKLFTLKGSRKRHERVHMASAPTTTDIASDLARDLANVAEDERECKYCYKAFETDVLLKTHERTHIGEERPFSCKCCKKTFLDHLGRRKHELRHPEMRMYSCKFCHKRFSKQNLWEIHESHHTEDRPYKCRYCERDFTNQSNRTNHETAHKSRGDVELNPAISVVSNLPDGLSLPSSRSPTRKLAKLPCRLCGKRFVTKGGRHKHERNTHRLHGAGQLQSQHSTNCKSCGVSFNTQVQLAMHKCMGGTAGTSQTTPQVTQVFSCKVCGAKFGNKVSMLRHQSSHSARSTLSRKQCKYCKKVLSSHYAVVVHERIHTGEKPFACNRCDFRTNDKSHLSKHVKRHDSNAPYTLKCSICSHKFMSQYSLKIHEAQHRAERLVLTCTECDKRFATPEELDIHLQAHAGGDPDASASPMQMETNDIEIDIGIDSFETSSNNDGSGDNGEEEEEHEGAFKAYRCTYCEGTFATPEDLQSHEHLHEKEQPFKCDKCGRSFKTNNGLEKHTPVCLEVKPFKCQYCSKCFSTDKGCHLHEESHIVQRPFQCSHCERGFLSTHSREMHEKTHTL